MQEKKGGQAETESSGGQSPCWASREHRLLQKRNRCWSRRLRNSCHFPGVAPPQHSPAPPSLRGSTPTPTPRPAASCHLLLPSCITESPQALNPLLRLRTGASEESICSLYSGLDPPRGGPKGPGSRSPEEGPFFLTDLGGCRETSFLCAPPASEQHTQLSGPGSLPPISSWSLQLDTSTPAQAHHPQAPLLKAGPLSDGGSGSPGGW